MRKNTNIGNDNEISHEITKFEITRTRREPFFEMEKAHNHNAYEIYYLIEGRRRFFIEDTIYTISAGDFIIISKELLHKTTYVSNDVHERYDIYIPNTLMEKFKHRFGEAAIEECFANPYLPVPFLQRDYIEGLMDKTLDEFCNRDSLSSQLIMSYLTELMVFIIRQRRKNEKNGVGCSDGTDGLSQKAAKYIFSNYSENITLDDAAKYVNLSSSHFSKKFKDDTGFGFKEYLLNVRIKHASEYLVNTDMTINEIALACGFTDSNYFGDVFKRIKGVSPSVYRKENTA